MRFTQVPIQVPIVPQNDGLPIPAIFNEEISCMHIYASHLCSLIA